MNDNEESVGAVTDGKNYLKMLSDPIRSRILIETLLRGKITAKDLMEILNINRSAISYHLGLMVENNVLDVEINEIGRPVKSYSMRSRDLITKFDEMINSASEEEKRELLLAKLNLFAGTMQMLGNLSVDAIQQIKDSSAINDVGSSINSIVDYTFKNNKEFFVPLVFDFLSPDEVKELMDDFIDITIKKIGPTLKRNSQEIIKEGKVPYLMMFSCFPLLHVGKTADNE